jgi:hypothetical protein
MEYLYVFSKCILHSSVGPSSFDIHKLKCSGGRWEYNIKMNLAEIWRLRCGLNALGSG